ncbi:hypothetical protein LINPERPRIM_LOCUS33129 [Linum perenne]
MSQIGTTHEFKIQFLKLRPNWVSSRLSITASLTKFWAKS